MKKLIKFLVVVALVAVMAVCFVACDNPLDNDGRKDFVLSNTGDVISTALVSSANILNGLATDNETQGNQLANANDITDAEIDEIHNQIQMFEAFIGSNPLSVNIEASDREAYEHRMTISFKDLNNQESSYILYYNQVLKSEENDDEDDDIDLDDLMEIDVEQEYTLSGIMIVGENEYTIIGEKEIEDGEYEMSIIAKIDDNNYILIEQEIENDEQELSYQVWKDGKKVTSFSMSLENEKGETSVKIKSSVDGQVTYRKFSKEEKNGQTTIKIKQTVGNEQYNVIVKITKDAQTGEEIYKYITDNGKEIEKKD